MTDLVATTYKCTRCGETDHDRGVNSPAPVALHCWNCGAGRGKQLAEMIQAKAGMFPQREAHEGAN